MFTVPDSKGFITIDIINLCLVLNYVKANLGILTYKLMRKRFSKYFIVNLLTLAILK